MFRQTSANIEFVIAQIQRDIKVRLEKHRESRKARKYQYLVQKFCNYRGGAEDSVRGSIAYAPFLEGGKGVGCS